MPFDYNEFSQGVAQAREAKVSDDDILSHLASIDQGFKDAKENGYSLNDIDSFLKEKYKTKGGDKNDAYQTSQDQQGGSGDSNEQGMQTIPLKAISSQGVQANDQPSSQDQQVVQGSQQSNLNIKTALTGDSQFGIGGEPLERQEQMSVGSGYKGPQAEVQQAIPSEGKAGEQTEVAPKPAPFPTVQSEGDSLGIQAVKSLGTGIAQGLTKFENIGLDNYNTQFQGAIAGAKAAEYLFGKNPYTDAFINEIPLAKNINIEASRRLEESQKGRGGLLNGILYQTGSLIPDILSLVFLPKAKPVQYLKEGLMATGAKGLAADIGVLGKKAINGMIDFAPASIASAKMEMDKSLKEGKGDVESLTTFYKTLFEYEIVAALPLGVTSRLNNVWKRGASRFLQSFGLVAAQHEIATTLNNAISQQQKKAPTLTENLLTGKFGQAAEQLAGAIPMALLGIKGGHDDFTPGVGKDRKDLKGVTDILNQLGLPETAKTMAEPPPIPQPKVPKFASRDTIIYNANKRYEELTKKRDAGEAFTDQEKEELAVLEKVPTVEELASHYGITIQEPKKKPAKAKAEVQPEKPSEEQVKETSGVSTEQGKPSVEAPEVKTQEGTPQREGEGKEEVVKTPEQKAEEMTSFAEASTPEEVDAFLAKNEEDAKLIAQTKQRNSFLSQARKQALARKKEIKSEATKKAKEEASKPKPSKEPVMEAPAPEPEPIPEEAPKEQGEPKARKPRKEKPSEPMGTRVLSAAFRPNKGKNKGKVFYGASHKQAMLKSGMSWMEIQKDYAHPEQREGLEFGYKTDTKPFVSRDKGEQVARLSGQADVEKLDADKSLGYKMHSNHLSLDDHPETAGQGQKFGPGAMKKAEKGVPFGEKDHNADLVKSAQIHKDLAKGEFKGGANYSTWSKAFEKAFPDAKNYSEDERFNLFKQGESLAAHSEFFKKELNQAVKFPKMWSEKSVKDIKNESTDRSTQDIRFTNKAIDDEREARGLDPIMKQAAIASGEHWEEAMEQINSREGYAAAFINSLKKNVRVLSPVETSILRHSVAEAMAKRDTAAGKLSREPDSRLAKRYTREYEDAQRDYAELSELYSRSNSEAGRTLGFLRMLVKADYSLPSLITKARAGKRRAGKADANLSPAERDALAKISEDIEKAEKEFYDSLEAQKLKENKLGLIQYLEFSSKLISTIEGEKSDAKSELNRYSAMFKNSRQDPISMGLAVRGMARNLSQIMKTKNEDTILDAVHDRLSNIMGDTWGKDQTLDILNGNGVFFHTTEEGVKYPLRQLKEKSDAFNKQFANALKKSPAKREFILSKMLERFSIEVHNLEAQINGHMDDVLIDADRIIGELDNDLLSCE